MCDIHLLNVCWKMVWWQRWFYDLRTNVFLWSIIIMNADGIWHKLKNLKQTVPIGWIFNDNWFEASGGSNVIGNQMVVRTERHKNRFIKFQMECFPRYFPFFCYWTNYRIFRRPPSFWTTKLHIIKENVLEYNISVIGYCNPTDFFKEFKIVGFLECSQRIRVEV